MILITLGTQDKEFTRLLKKVDELIDKGIIKDEVIAQVGHTKYSSDNMKIFDYVDSNEFKEYVKNADYVICHAGVGTIFDCMGYDKKIIAVPRLKEFKEHNNDHQLEIAKEFGKLNCIIPVFNIDDLEEAIDRVKDFKPSKYVSGNYKVVSIIDNYIENNSRRTIKDLFNKYREIILYLIFGVLTTIVSLAIYFILTETILNANNDLELQCANIISWIVSVTFAYFTNRKYVFESENKNKMKEAFSFYAARVFTLILDMLIMFIGVSLLKQSDKIFKILSQIIVIVSNYVLSKLMVFRKKDV